MNTILLALDPAHLTDDQRAELEALAAGYRLLITTDRQEIAAALETLEVAAGHFDHGLIPRAPRLRWVQQWGAGADWLMRRPKIAGHDFFLTNASGVHAVPMSEHILAMMLALARRLCRAYRAKFARQWDRPEFDDVFELAGKTMPLIGVGDIGARTARIAAAMDMRVIGVRRHPEVSAPGVARMVGPDRLPEVLPEADFLVLTVPLTPETEGMIGEAEFALLKPGACIFNVGRGRTIDQAAMVRALQDGRLAGAGLDVTDPEPLPADSPLWAMDNVVLTPHYSGRTPRYDERAMAIFLDNLARYRAGRPLRNVVDKGLAY